MNFKFVSQCEDTHFSDQNSTLAQLLSKQSNNQTIQLMDYSTQQTQRNQFSNQNSISNQFTPQSQAHKSIREGINVTYDSSSYVSSTTTVATRIVSLQNRLKRDQNSFFDSSNNNQAKGNGCYQYQSMSTDEIKQDEVFMPQTVLPRECHESKLKWEKENRDFFHLIRDIDTGRAYDVRKVEELKEIEEKLPIIELKGASEWQQWWEAKRSIRQEFEKACKLNLGESIKQIIQNSESDFLPNLDSAIQDGWTPLHFSAYYGNTSICNLLILNDVLIDSVNCYQQTPLILSCLENKQDVVSLLIESGANINAQDIYLNTPLHYCFLNGDKDLLDIVIKKPYLDAGLRNNNNKLPEEETDNEELVDYFKQQMYKKEQQRKIKTRMQIIEYEEEDLYNIFSNPQSFFSNIPNNAPQNDNSQYIVQGILGKGTFGEVYLVRERSSWKEFALKMLDKNQIIDNNMYKYAITERNILQIVDHPFIVKLFKAFQTKDKLFFLMENAKQGDVLQHLKYEKKFSETKAQFYAAEVLLALEYLHSLDIIYRDLKAQNILIGEDGHIRLSDFGLSKEGVKDYDKGARSFCGSVAYMPPEILRNQGHGKSLDLYLLGAFIYEMLTGQAPFYGKDEATIYNNIQMNLLKFPPNVSRTAKSLLVKLLSKDSRFRPTPENIKKHPFFQGINWKQLELKNIKPPKFMQQTQLIYDTAENVFLEKGEITISPNKLQNLTKEIESIEQKKGLFNKWTFIANP